MRHPRHIGWLAVAAIIATHASADVIDQVYDAGADGSVGGPGISSVQEVAQTFTVGIGGTLSLVEVQVQQGSSQPDQDLVLRILGTNAGAPDLGQVLATTVIPRADVPPLDFDNPEFVGVDVGGFGIIVAPGDVLAIHLQYPTGTGSYFCFGQFEGTQYGGGEAYSRLIPNDFHTSVPSDDLGFRTSVFVPAPSAAALLGFAGLGASRRRR